MILVLRSFVIAIAVLTPSAALTTPAWESKPSTLFGLVIVAARGEIARQKFLPAGGTGRRAGTARGTLSAAGARPTALLPRQQLTSSDWRPRRLKFGRRSGGRPSSRKLGRRRSSVSKTMR